MMERPLLTPDELESIPKGSFIVMKTGSHPMQTRLRLFLDWGITFEEPYAVPERVQRQVLYASRQALERSILKRYGKETDDDSADCAVTAKSGMAHTPAPDRRRGQRQVKV